MCLFYRMPIVSFLVVAAAVVSLMRPLLADTFRWSGEGSNRYFTTAENWVGGVAPVSADDLHIHLQATASNYSPIVDVAELLTLNRLSISNSKYNVSGNTLRFAGADARIVVGPGSHGFGFTCPLELASDLTLEMQQSYNFFINGVVDGSGGFTVTGGHGGGSREGHFCQAATYAGPTRLFGWFTLYKPGGRIVNSSRIDVYPSGTLSLQAGGVGEATNRVTDTIPVYLYNGLLLNLSADETIDEVTAVGALGYLQANTGILRVGRLVRHRGGAARIRGAATLGLTGGPRLFIGTVDDTATADLLAGGGGAAGSTTVSIVPCLHADDTFTTYDDTDGFRRLDLATEYVDGLPAAGPFDNVVQTNSVVLAADTAVNALVFRSYSLEVSGDHTLRLNSGAFLTAQNTRNQKITCSRLDFAGREAFITVHNTGGYSTPLTISSVITNAAGLTFAGTHSSNPASSPLTLTGANTYTGRTSVLVGILNVQGGDNRLPIGYPVSVGYGALLQILNINQTLAGVDGTGNINISNAGKTMTLASDADHVFAGSIKGAGNLFKHGSGTQWLTAESTYTGATIISNGILRVDGALVDAAGKVTVGAGGTLAGIGAVSRAVMVDGGTLAPGAPHGTFTVASNVVFAANATMAVSVAAAGTGRLVCGAEVMLDGALTVTLEDGFQPRANQEWVIIDASGGVSGSFATRDAKGFMLEQNNNTITLRYLPKGTMVVVR